MVRIASNIVRLTVRRTQGLLMVQGLATLCLDTGRDLVYMMDLDCVVCERVSLEEGTTFMANV